MVAPEPVLDELLARYARLKEVAQAMADAEQVASDVVQLIVRVRLNRKKFRLVKQSNRKFRFSISGFQFESLTHSKSNKTGSFSGVTSRFVMFRSLWPWWGVVRLVS